MKICVVIAAYNEEGNIGPLTERLIATLSSMKDYSWSLIYVIEGDDRTREIAEKFAAERREIRILYQLKPDGLGAAFRRGFASIPVDADFVITLDADQNHQPEEIPRLLKSLRARRADIVIGSRKIEGSRVEGASRWKTTLSNTVNWCMRRFLHTPMQDQSSGFRIYRGNLLRNLEFRNNGFAFLPELLLAAASRGARIVEEPILFTFRTVGNSKMKLIPTGLSYVRLFVAWTLGAWTLGALGLLLVGIVLRFAFIFPEHKMFADSDAVLAALCAFDIMDGKLPVFFPGGTRLGALSCYSAAAAFELFGISRLTLTIPSLLFSCGFNLFMYLFFRETLGKRLSFLALMFIVLPPMQFLLVTYPPWGYAEILLFCSAALWLGSLLAKETPSVSVAFFYGLCVGLGLYSSLQSLMVLLPQWAWLLLVKKKWKIDSKAAWVLAGCALGFGPWLLFVASSGISSVFGGQLLRTSNTWYQVWLNITYFFDYNLPVLLFECNAGQLLVFSRKTLQAGLYAMALLPFFFVFFGYARYRSISYYGWDRDRFMLALFSAALFLTTLAMYSFSGAGAVRGWTVRYIAPIYIAMATAWAIGLSVPIRIFPKATWCIVIAIVLLNVPGYPIINHPVRKAWEAAMARDQRLLEVIQQNDIQAVVGDYWQVYYLNFLSRRGIAAIPTISALDYMSYANKLNGRSVRWALIANSPEKLTKWADRCQLRGSLLNINPGTCLFLPSPNPPIVDSTAFLKLVQAAAILH